MSRVPLISLAARLLLAVLLLPLACSSKQPRYPADHARFQRIDAAVEAFRQAYTQKSLTGLQAIMLPLDSLERLQADIRSDFEAYQEIALDFTVDRIVIEGETIDVYVHWQGHWKRSASDPGLRERGHGLLRWVGVQSILLSAVEGDVPFGMALRQTG